MIQTFATACAYLTPPVICDIIADLWGLEDDETTTDLLATAMQELVNNVGREDAADLLAVHVPALDFSEWEDVLS